MAIFPRSRLITVSMCVFMRASSTSLETGLPCSRPNQGGVRSSFAQTRQWPTIFSSFARANSTKRSAVSNDQRPGSGCTASGFMQFSGVTREN